MPAAPKKTVRVQTLNTLLAEWEDRCAFCAAEAEKYPRSTYGHREWEGRASTLRRAIRELRDRIEN